MADQKISQLTEVTSPSATDVLPVVNASTTKKLQLANIPVSTATQTALDGKIEKYDESTYDINAFAAVTQAEYDALTPSATTIYFII